MSPGSAKRCQAVGTQANNSRIVDGPAPMFNVVTWITVMPTQHSARHSIDLKQLETSLTLYAFKLRKLQRVWIPLQQYAPQCVLALWLIGVCVSLVTLSYYHWLVIAPAIGLLITLEIIIEEVQIDLLLMTDEARYLLDVTRDIYHRSTHSTGAPCRP